MKLRTRIILISSAAVLIALLIGDVVIWGMMRKSRGDETFIKAYQNYYVFINELESQISHRKTSSIDEIYLEYLFKKYKNDYNICFKVKGNNTVEIYNHTTFSAYEFYGLEYEAYDDADYTYLNYGGRKYIIFRKNLEGYIEVYRIEDITYLWDEMEKLAFGMFLITLVVTSVAILFLLPVLKTAFAPLQELSNTTKDMAEGLYDKRIAISRDDEIGLLGENFNKMADAVEARTHSLEESEKRKTLFMGSLTHELKTPMTTISGYAQTLLSVKVSVEEQEEALLYIYEECNRLSRLSKKMMRLLELDWDNELNLTDIPVKRLFDAAVRSCQVILRDKKIELECVEHGESFLMDIDLMTDVIINLIDNAVKASRTGGRIVLRAYDGCIEVQDFGRGIPVDEQERIMEPFYMIDKSRSRKNGGAGLGLALTAMIVEKHNVSIRIDSEVGKGSRFILQFV